MNLHSTGAFIKTPHALFLLSLLDTVSYVQAAWDFVRAPHCSSPRQLPQDSCTQHSAPGASVTTPPRAKDAHTQSGDQKQSSAKGLSTHAFTKSREWTQRKSDVKWGGAKKASNSFMRRFSYSSVSEAEEAHLFLEFQMPWSVPKFSMPVKSSHQFSFFFYLFKQGFSR